MLLSARCSEAAFEVADSFGFSVEFFPLAPVTVYWDSHDAFDFVGTKLDGFAAGVVFLAWLAEGDL